MFKSAAVLSATGLVLVLSGTAWAEEYESLATGLAELRGEVEELSGELADKKGDLQDEVRTYARQKSELSLEKDREEIKLQKLRLSIAQKRDAVEAERAKSKALLPVFEKAAERARTYIRQSLPFRVDERLAEVDKVAEQLKAGLLTPQNAVSRIWSVLEDEFRMTRDSGLFKQTIAVDGEEQLAEVVRLGMVMMYYRTGDGTVGHAVQKEGKWTFARISSPKDVKRVELLFDSFKKQIRQGYFEVPAELAWTVKP